MRDGQTDRHAYRNIPAVATPSSDGLPANDLDDDDDDKNQQLRVLTSTDRLVSL